LFYDDAKIKIVRTTKYLGLHLDDQLNFETELYTSKRNYLETLAFSQN